MVIRWGPKHQIWDPQQSVLREKWRLQLSCTCKCPSCIGIQTTERAVERNTDRADREVKDAAGSAASSPRDVPKVRLQRVSRAQQFRTRPLGQPLWTPLVPRRGSQVRLKRVQVTLMIMQTRSRLTVLG